MMILNAVRVCLFCALVVLCIAPCNAEQLFDFNIPESEARKSLKKFALQSKSQIIFPHDELSKYSLNALKGKFKLRDAIDILTRDTGVKLSFVDNTIRVDLGKAVDDDHQITLDYATPSTEKNTSYHIEHIEVTARKRLEIKSEVPIAMSVFDMLTLNTLGAHQTGDFLNLSPGVNVIDAGDYQHLSIRGVSTSLGSNANGYYLDHVPITGVTVPAFPLVQTFDVNRVEVLRGPQGTVFGDGSLGGTVRILTNTPDLSKISGKFDGHLSSTGGGGTNNSLRNMLNVPLIEDLAAIRLVTIDDFQEGWIDLDGGKIDHNAIESSSNRIQLRLSPEDYTIIDFGYWESTQEVGGSHRALNDMTVLRPESLKSYEFEQTSVYLERTFDDFQIAYSYGNNVSANTITLSNPEFEAISGHLGIGIKTKELIFRNIDENIFDWTIGYYSRNSVRNEIISFSDNLESKSDTTSDSAALFGEVEYHINEKWRFSLGARYFSEKLGISEFAQSNEKSAFISREARFNNVSPKLSVSYLASDRTLVYASASQGFRGGQAQPGAALILAENIGLPLPELINPDVISTYEIGGKSAFLDRELQVEWATFYSFWKDVPVRYELIPNSINGIYQADGVRIAGFELSIESRLSETLSLIGNFSYLDPRYTSDIPNSPIRKGDAPENVSRFAFSCIINFKKDAYFSGFEWAGTLSADFFSERENTSYSNYTHGDDIVLINARIGLNSSRYGFYFFANNVTNNDKAISARQPDIATRAQPLTLGFEASYRF